MPFITTRGRDPRISKKVINDGSNNDGSFSKSPIVLYDQVLHYTDANPVGAVFQSVVWDDSQSRLETVENGTTNDNFPIDTVPLQWHENRPGPVVSNVYALRCREFDGVAVTQTPFGDPIGTWRNGPLEGFKFGISRPGAISTVESILTIEMAEASDHNNILARARITLRYTRTF